MSELNDIFEAIELAMKRITDGHAPMRIPADLNSDPDIVLDRCKAEITALQAKVEELEKRLADRPVQIRNHWIGGDEDECSSCTKLRAKVEEQRAEIERSHSAILSLTGRVEELTRELDEARGMSAVDRSGCDRALQQMEDAVTVMQAQQQRAEQLTKQLRDLGVEPCV